MSYYIIHYSHLLCVLCLQQTDSMSHSSFFCVAEWRFLFIPTFTIKLSILTFNFLRTIKFSEFLLETTQMFFCKTKYQHKLGDLFVIFLHSEWEEAIKEISQHIELQHDQNNFVRVHDVCKLSLLVICRFLSLYTHLHKGAKMLWEGKWVWDFIIITYDNDNILYKIINLCLGAQDLVM